MVFKIKISKGQNVNILCCYRQCNLLDNLKTSTSHTLPEQISGLNNIIEVIKDLRASDQQLLLIGDLNIDLLEVNDPLSRYNIRKLTRIYKSVIDDTGLCQLNFKPTRFRARSNPSLLDHYFASHPNRTNSIETKQSIIADHWMVKLNYHYKVLESKPQFRKVRDCHLLNSDSLMTKIDKNSKLGEIFKLGDPDKIA